MKHINYLLLLPMVALLTIAFTACSGLTDEEQKFIGTWSSETHFDSILDEESNIRMICTANDLMTYHEDRIYDDETDVLVKVELPFNDATIRLYWFFHGVSTNSWSASNGVYSDSIINASFKNVVDPSKVVAIKDNRTGGIERYGLYDKSLSENYDIDIVKALREMYKELSQGFLSEEGFYDKSKSLYKILSLGVNRIVYEDNDGQRFTLLKGKVQTPRVQQMLSEGNVLR